MRLRAISILAKAVICLIVFGATTAIYSQNICPISTTKVDSPRGLIVWNDKLGQPVEQAPISVKRSGENEITVVSTKTDNAGRFEVSIPKGHYVVDVQAIINGQTLFTYRFILKLRRSNYLKGNKQIMVKIGVDCYSSEVTVVRQR